MSVNATRIKNTFMRTTLLTSTLLATSASTLLAQSAWLPNENQLVLTPGFTYSTFDEFWMGRDKVDNPPNGKSLNQYYGYLFADYGIVENLAADATVGYTWTDSEAFGDVNDDGLADTSVGLRYRLIDETTSSCPYTPTIALRVGGVIPGTYDENLPFSPGDGAYGLESSLLLARAIGDSGFGIYGDIGYRMRENPVPDDLFGSAGIYQQLGHVTLTFEYRHTQSLSGLDIGGPGFNPANDSTGFPAVKEITQLVQAGVTFTDRAGRSYQFTAAKSVDGRNTGDRLLFGFNITIPFGAR
jgi:hypothetical protein